MIFCKQSRVISASCKDAKAERRRHLMAIVPIKKSLSIPTHGILTLIMPEFFATFSYRPPQAGLRENIELYYYITG